MNAYRQLSDVLDFERAVDLEAKGGVGIGLGFLRVEEDVEMVVDSHYKATVELSIFELARHDGVVFQNQYPTIEVQEGKAELATKSTC